MKSLAGLFVGFAFCVLPGLAVCQTAKPSLKDIGWIAGCWEMTIPDKDFQVTEQWMKPGGGMMLGSGRTVKAGKTIDYEFVRIVEDIDGIFYVARPLGNKEETKFKLIKVSASEVVFENLLHDFPQRVIYKRQGDRLSARVEATEAGKTRGIDFLYLRAKCE